MPCTALYLEWCPGGELGGAQRKTRESFLCLGSHAGQMVMLLGWQWPMMSSRFGDFAAPTRPFFISFLVHLPFPRVRSMCMCTVRFHATWLCKRLHPRLSQQS